MKDRLTTIIRNFRWAFLLGIFLNPTFADNPFEGEVYSAPSGTLYCQIDRDGVSVIPNGRILTPRGKQILLEPHPYGMTISPNGKVIITVNSGTDPFSLSIIENPTDSKPKVTQIPEGIHTNEGVLNACFMGVAIPSDEKPDILRIRW
jgi:hypothetical protein